MSDRPLRIGISACLLGQEVRFDGGHKRDEFLTQVLGRHVEYVPVCPEVEMGLGTPRETLRLMRQPRGLRMITTRTGIDHTDGMIRWAGTRLAELDAEDLSGYVLKTDSPSCGMERVKTYGDGTSPVRDGRGIYASALIERWPLLPVEEEGRLCDPTVRENFIERIFAYRRLRDFFRSRWTPGTLVAFHTTHKMSLLSHSTTAYDEMGHLVARSAAMARADLRHAYETLFMATLAKPATRARHASVLRHMAGQLETRIDARSRAELAVCVDDCRRALVPLVVPLTLIRHLARAHDVEDLQGQVYLNPHPCELMLRNHV